MDSQICYNKGSDEIFICSNCGAIIIGVMIDDFDCAIEYTKAAQYCSNCRAKIIKKYLTLNKGEEWQGIKKSQLLLKHIKQIKN